jgi:hypothetical protein
MNRFWSEFTSQFQASEHGLDLSITSQFRLTRNGPVLGLT